MATLAIMKSFLTLKHWQVFSILLVGIILFNLTIEGNPLATMIVEMLGLVVYTLWTVIVGNELNQLLPKKIEVNFNFFLMNIFICLGTMITVLILSNGEGMTFSGWYAIPVLYVFFAYLYCLAFPMKLLNSIETGKEASLGEYIGDFFLVLFLPIGIWFLQPRINKIVADRKIAALHIESPDATTY